VTLAQTDYLDSRRNVIWDYTHYPDYSASIAGVGRDDSVRLYQKQTYFADNQMIVGIAGANTTIVGANDYSPLQSGTNEDNPAFIADGDFIVFGMDGVLPTVSEIYTQSGETYEVIGRSMVQVTGNANIYNTIILLDTTVVETQNFASPQSAPVLLIDRSGTGSFPAGETEQVFCSDTDTLGHYVYSNIHWDTDFNGRDFFCFAVTMPDTTGTPKALAADSGNGMAQDNGNATGAGANTDVEANNYSPLQATDNGTGLKNASSKSPQYRLLPNPNHGNFAVEIAYPEAQDVTVAVYDSDGRLLLTMSGKGQHAYRFESSVPAAGHYLIDITSPAEHKTLKMIVN